MSWKGDEQDSLGGLELQHGMAQRIHAEEGRTLAWESAAFQTVEQTEVAGWEGVGLGESLVGMLMAGCAVVYIGHQIATDGPLEPSRAHALCKLEVPESRESRD